MSNAMETKNKDERLSRQFDFIVEIDKAKNILRQTSLIDGSRRENDAEHSWHLATMAILLSEYAEEDVDLLRVVKMLLIHDIVEIDAGDTFAYDTVGNQDKAEREEKAAKRLFDLLPRDQGLEMRRLWEEFEARTTPEASFAAALDRLQPLLHNYHTEGATWRQHGVTKKDVVSRNEQIQFGSQRLWQYAHALIDDAVKQGILKET